MAQSKIEKIASIDDEIKQLKERQKQLLQQQNAKERKDRPKRLCKRMGLLESMLPDTIPLTDEQFKIFLEKAVATEHRRGRERGQCRKGNGLTAPTLVKTRPHIPHECGICGLADSVLCLSAQKETKACCV